MTVPADTLSSAAIRDTVARVFAEPEFHRVAAQSLLARGLGWLAERVAELMHFARSAPLLGWGLLALVAVFVAAVGLRIVTALAEGREGTGRLGPSFSSGAAREDPWSAAQRLAAAGDYTSAAHALYAGILDAVARRGLVRLHHAKTIGDYLRELRQRTSGATAAAFRDFTRVYEVVVYGVGACDRQRFERLATLATAVRDG